MNPCGIWELCVGYFETFKINEYGHEIHNAKIKYEKMLSESFTFNNRVKQGDGLLATLFIMKRSSCDGVQTAPG